jgi:ABC-2 type transport system ATP-binding protein
VLKIQIIDTDNRDQVYSSLQQLETVALVDFAKEDKNGFVINSKDETSSRKDIFQLCVKNNWILTEMTPLETKLEDIFRELTTTN